MYSVSNAYLAAIKQPIQVHKVRGTIGSVAFTDENILDGSFSISNQSTDTSDIVLGSCYIGQLSATFTGLNISRTEWMNKVITPYFQLWFDDQNYEEVPLGVFTIKEVNHTAEGVEVVAYDNMYKFDKKFKKSGLNMVAKPYNFLIVFCQKCGIELGMNSTQVEALPNGNADLYLCGVRKSTTTYANDIETYRDALFWLAQCLGSFATIRRDGKLVLRAYKDTVDDSISDMYRLSGAKFADYITSYTGIYTDSLYDGETTYYGYDLATLQQMRDTAMQELEQIITDLADLEEEYAQGQITEEEYKAQKKVLTSEKKAKEKYISWLDKMIAQAQAEGDGAYMDLGANPFFQRRDANIPSIADATLATTLRAHILSALGKIEYTPFTCSSVFGVHYDLGDVIEFNGGHADDDHGCIMSYEWTLHGQYNMEGYGIDPDKQNVKTVDKKQSERAQKNALNSSKNISGSGVDIDAKDGDLKVTAGGANLEALDVDNYTASSTQSHPISITDEDLADGNLYMIEVKGIPSSWGDGEELYIPLEGLTVGESYKIEFDGQFTQAQSFTEAGADFVTVCGTVINLTSDREQHHYSATFTYVDNGEFYFTPFKVQDNYWFTYVFSNLKVSKNDGGGKIEVYENNEWRNVGFVRSVSQTQTSTGGTKIATANNSDGTNTDIYAPSVSANPSGASTNLTSLGIAGTDYVIKDANAIPSTEKGANGGVAELDNSGKVPTSQLPSYVDDVVEYASRNAFPATGESGKIYIALDTNLTYRWSGSEYVEISPSLALGETSSTAYRGDRGKTAYDHATESGKISAAVASGLYKIAATAQGHVASLTAVQKSDLTALGVADADNIPTKTSQLTNDSGFITSYTDEKVTCEGVNPSGETAYNLILVPNTGFTANQKPKVNSYFKTYLKKGTANDAGYNYLVLGNDTPTGENANQYGCLRLFGEKYGFSNLRFDAASTTERTHYLPDTSGTIALTSDIPTKTSDLTNDSGFITDGQGAKTVKSTLVTITDAAAIYAEDITADIEPIQSGSGTPSPSNICPIQGHEEEEIAVCGKNLFGGLDFANALHDASNTSTIDTTNKTVTYNRYKTETTVLFDKLKPNTTYTLILTGNVNSANTVNNSIALRDKEGGLHGFTFNSTTKTRKKITLDNVEALILTWANGAMATVYYDECGLFEGEVTVEQFEEYQGQDYVLPLSNKNLIPMQFDNTHILAYNTSGSWNDHTYTSDGVDITVYTLTKYSDIVTGIRIKGDATNNLSFMLCNYGDDFVFTEAIKMNASGTSNADIDIIAMDKNNTSKAEIRTTLSSADVSVTDNKFAKVVVIVNSGFSGDVMIYPQIRKAKYSADFAPHNPRLPEVVYGGTLDVTSGVLTVDRASVDLGSLSYTKSSQGNKYYATIPSYPNRSDLTMLSSCYGFDGYGNAERGYYPDNGKFRYFYVSPSSVAYEIYLTDERYSNVSDLKTALNGQTLVYPIATPTTYQLTPQEVKLLLNLNNITASTGQVQVKYQPNNAIGEAIGYIQDYIERHAPKTYYPKII